MILLGLMRSMVCLIVSPFIHAYSFVKLYWFDVLLVTVLFAGYNARSKLFILMNLNEG
uniref:Uncharacterized protein n=1 Tax=Arundo donax TaxID=35708 RepID=A0A0A9G453_ARUDO